MGKIILRFYKISKEEQRKYDLYCNTRYIAYDYINKTYTDAGLPESHITKNEFLKNNKCKFKKVKRIEKIEKFEKVIQQNKYSMLQITVLYNMSCHENYKKLTDRQKEILLSVIYSYYILDTSLTDLASISDVVMGHYKEILYEKEKLNKFGNTKQLIKKYITESEV